MATSFFRRFFLPQLTSRFLLRVTVLAVITVLIFTHVLVPLRIEGQSMEPTYKDGSFTFCWRGRYLFSNPGHGDVVAIRFAGRQVVLLKRIIALAGETVEFRDGVLLVNGRQVEEPYISRPFPWNLPPRKVEPGKVYVVGDNRSVPLERHHMGQVDVQRILGGVF
ncbi:MAG: signal peptidase I [Desulfobulbus sp.]|nr:signal peptidase I [Desulfobulbus sp.]